MTQSRIKVPCEYFSKNPCADDVATPYVFTFICDVNVDLSQSYEVK